MTTTHSRNLFTAEALAHQAGERPLRTALPPQPRWPLFAAALLPLAVGALLAAALLVPIDGAGSRGLLPTLLHPEAAHVPHP